MCHSSRTGQVTPCSLDKRTGSCGSQQFVGQSPSFPTTRCDRAGRQHRQEMRKCWIRPLQIAYTAIGRIHLAAHSASLVVGFRTPRSGVLSGPPPPVVEFVQRYAMHADCTLNLHAEQTETRVGEQAKLGCDHRAPMGPRSVALGT